MAPFNTGTWPDLLGEGEGDGGNEWSVSTSVFGQFRDTNIVTNSTLDGHGIYNFTNCGRNWLTDHSVEIMSTIWSSQNMLDHLANLEPLHSSRIGTRHAVVMMVGAVRTDH